MAGAIRAARELPLPVAAWVTVPPPMLSLPRPCRATCPVGGFLAWPLVEEALWQCQLTFPRGLVRGRPGHTASPSSLPPRTSPSLFPPSLSRLKSTVSISGAAVRVGKGPLPSRGIRAANSLTVTSCCPGPASFLPVWRREGARKLRECAWRWPLHAGHFSVCPVRLLALCQNRDFAEPLPSVCGSPVAAVAPP